MEALTIIKHDQVVNHAERGMSSRFGWLVREAFFFQASEHPFHDGIVITIAFPTHAADHLGGPELALILATRILTPSIRMMQQPWLGVSLPNGHLQGLRHQTCRHRRRTGPAHDFPGKQIDGNRDIQPPLQGPEGRDITAPHSIGGGDHKLPVEPIGAMGDPCRLSVVCGRRRARWDCSFAWRISVRVR